MPHHLHLGAAVTFSAFTGVSSTNRDGYGVSERTGYIVELTETDGVCVSGFGFVGHYSATGAIKGSDDLRYIYISFMGADAQKLLKDMHITPEAPVFRDHKDLCQTFYTTVQNTTPDNAMILAQGLLFFTLSRLQPTTFREEPQGQKKFNDALEYVDLHFTDPNLCLKTIAQISSYTEKYVSALFIKEKKISFSKYLTYLRIERAKNLLATKVYTVGQVAQLCGFTDQLYFSRVFRKETGCTPSAFKQSTNRT